MRGLWFVEHGLVEWSTTLALLLAALNAAGLWLRRGFLLQVVEHRPYLGIVFPLALLAFLDELSFGDGVIDYEQPVLQGYRITSVHDLLLPLAKSFRLVVGLDTASAALVLTAGATIITALLARAFRSRIAALRRWVDASALRPAWLSLGYTLVLAVPAILLDNVGPAVGPAWTSQLQVAEELFELAAALSLLSGILWVRRFEGRMATGLRRVGSGRPRTRREAPAYGRGSLRCRLQRVWPGR